MKPLTELQNKAIKLRKRGLSYGEIKKHVNVAKSSLSLWLKHIELKPEYKARLYTKHIRFLNLGSQSQKERRAREVAEIIKNAEGEISFPLPVDTYRLMGAALYWAEGSKNGLCQVTNSDPRLICFMVKWIGKMFSIKPINLKARLNIYPQQNERQIKKFWSVLTGIPVERFGKSFVKPPSKGYKKNNLYYGTIKIEIPKSINIKHRIFGWLSAVLNEKTEIKLAERRWQSLRTVRTIPVNLIKNTRP